MQNVQPSLLTRPDTIFGVCEGIGEDFGFNPLYLRAVLAAMLLVNPVAVVATYAVLAVAVLVSRRLYPNPVSAPETASMATAIEGQSLRGENDAQPAEMAAAA